MNIGINERQRLISEDCQTKPSSAVDLNAQGAQTMTYKLGFTIKRQN